MKIDEVIQKLKDTIETFLDDPEMLSSRILASKGLRPSQLHYWAKKSDKIQPLLDELKELQEIKIYSSLLNPQNKNVTGMIFYAKTKLKAIEYEKELHHELELRKLELGNNPVSDFKLEINYNKVNNRSDDEIDEIIREVENEK